MVEVIVVGDKSKSQKLISEIQKHENFNKVIIYNDSNDKLFNFLDLYMPDHNGNPLVYVCKNYSCKLPTNDIKKIKDLLQ